MEQNNHYKAIELLRSIIEQNIKQARTNLDIMDNLLAYYGANYQKLKVLSENMQITNVELNSWFEVLISEKGFMDFTIQSLSSTIDNLNFLNTETNNSKEQMNKYYQTIMKLKNNEK